MKTNDEYTGGSTTYYQVDITHPINEQAQPYVAECQDIIDALGMTFNEGNAFKALWRRCAARTLGKSKRGYTDGLYDAEKVVFYGERLVQLEQRQRKADGVEQGELLHQGGEIAPNVAYRVGEAASDYCLPSDLALAPMPPPAPPAQVPAQRRDTVKQATHRDGGGSLFKQENGRWMQWGLDSWFTASADPDAVPVGLKSLETPELPAKHRHQPGCTEKCSAKSCPCNALPLAYDGHD
jgi:hypothetical protein